MNQENHFPSRKRIGTDESGKGDYFGPLVVAGVYLEGKEKENELQEMGVKDSKQLSDNRVKELARIIQKEFIHSIVMIGPEKYNQLYKKMRNLNRILAWGHSRVIENILERVECNYALTDQFGDKIYVLNALMEKGKKIIIHQQPRAEQDFAVAAASLLARAEFLKKLDTLSREIGISLPKGASSQVKEVAKNIVEKKGKEMLEKVAKIHFKITREIIQ